MNLFIHLFCIKKSEIWYKKQQHFNQIICNSGIISLWRFEDLPIKQISWNSNSFLDINLWHLKLKMLHVKSFNRLNIASIHAQVKGTDHGQLMLVLKFTILMHDLHLLVIISYYSLVGLNKIILWIIIVPPYITIFQLIKSFNVKT